MKTLPRVASEMALHVLAYNLTRVMNIMGVQPQSRRPAYLEKVRWKRRNGGAGGCDFQDDFQCAQKSSGRYSFVIET